MKKIIKTFVISSVVFYLFYAMIIGWGYLPPHGESGDLSFVLPELLSIAILIIPSSLIYAVFYTVALYLFSLLDEGFLNVWFVAGFALYSSIAVLTLSQTKFNSLPYAFGFILISLVIATLFMKTQKRETKPSI